MALTETDLAAIRARNTHQALLAPFYRITKDWTVETQTGFQKSIRELDLVASGDLEDEWSLKVIAHETGVVVADFTFPGYGRLHDMRRVNYSKPIPPESLIPWVKSKVEQNQIRFSTLAERRGLSFTDPRVIHDLAYRIARSGNFKLKRRRWYNKGKEASLSDLYDQLSAAMQEALLAGTKAGLQESAVVS